MRIRRHVACRAARRARAERSFNTDERTDTHSSADDVPPSDGVWINDKCLLPHNAPPPKKHGSSWVTRHVLSRVQCPNDLRTPDELNFCQLFLSVLHRTGGGRSSGGRGTERGGGTCPTFTRN